MKTQFIPNKRPQGFTYMTVVISMIVIGLMLAAYLKLVAVQNQMTVRSQTWNRSVPVLEAGIEEAIAHLNKNGAPNSNGFANLTSMRGDGWDNHGSPTGPWTKEGWIDDDYYQVTISSWNGAMTGFPVIQSEGFVKQLPAYAWRGAGGPFLAANEARAYSRRLVECTVTNLPTFSKALLAKHGIDMNGQNVYVDSYDSGNSLFSTNGRWVLGKRRDKGDIASNDTATNIINIQNADIWGRVATGPNGSAGWLHGSVGDAAWHIGGNQGIKPGFFTDDMNVEFRDIEVPAGSGGWFPAPGSGTLTTGNYLANNINGSITIPDNATVNLRVDGGWAFHGQDALTIGSNSTVTIYLNCPSADITGNGIINLKGKPIQCQIYGTSRLTSLELGGNGETTAVVYAPYANVTLHGGGNSDQDFSGAIVANTFRFSGHYTVHYDEALGRNGTFRGYTITSWNEK
jgi:hypothetical protein